MIFDNIKNCEMYYGVNSGFKKAFEFIKTAVAENYDLGRYEIDGENIYASVQEYDTKVIEGSAFEGHENYIDVQYIVDGREIMGVLEISKAVLKDEYDPEYDVTFYNRSESASYCVVESGDFCIFYPHDTHSPGVAFNNIPSKMRKIVVKIHV